MDLRPLKIWFRLVPYFVENWATISPMKTGHEKCVESLSSRSRPTPKVYRCWSPRL